MRDLRTPFGGTGAVGRPRGRAGSDAFLHRTPQRGHRLNRKHVMPTRDLLRNNRAWAERVRREDPGFESAVAPAGAEIPVDRLLRIRVPANQVVDLAPAKSSSTNIANVVVHTDLNFLSVIQFAVDVLRPSTSRWSATTAAVASTRRSTGRRVGIGRQLDPPCRRRGRSTRWLADARATRRCSTTARASSTHWSRW